MLKFLSDGNRNACLISHSVIINFAIRQWRDTSQRILCNSLADSPDGETMIFNTCNEFIAIVITSLVIIAKFQSVSLHDAEI